MNRFTRFLFYLFVSCWAHHIGEAKDDDLQEPNILHVHITTHTHDDVGWLKTVEQYYYGRNNTIQHACVSCILDSIMVALTQNPNRTFTYVEMAFFSTWWDEQTLDMKQTVRKLVASGQLSFANGGWCMHDEATTHYVGMMDQMTLGHLFLQSQLGYIPTVGWQLDPFGHSKFHAWMSRQMGFNSLYLGRIDHQDLKTRHETQNCESIWMTSHSLQDSDIFFSLTGSYNGGYGPPIQGFCFDVNCVDEPLTGLDSDALISRVYIFINALKLQASRTRGKNILITMGEDFQYENALVNFKNVDLLMETINRLPLEYLRTNIASNLDGIRVFYSNPEIYTRDKYKEWNRINVTQDLDIKEDDFFPYSDCDHCYWSGYFTSRPVLKRLDRFASAFLNTARKIDVLGYLLLGKHDELDSSSSFNLLERASGILQHHDGVSGTAKQHVADDYTRKVYIGMNSTASYLSTVVTRMLQPTQNSDHILLNFTYCDGCSYMASRSLSGSQSMLYAIFNPLSSKSDELVSIIISSTNQSYVVESLSEGSWVSVPCSLMGSDESLRKPNLLYFKANLPSLGFSMYRVTTVAAKAIKSDILDDLRNQLPSLTSSNRLRRGLMSSRSIKDDEDDDGDMELQNQFFTIQFKRGMMSSITLLGDDTNIDISQNYGFYKSFGSILGQNSGAYIFRPSKPNEKLTTLHPNQSSVRVIQTDLLTEVRTEFNVPWIKQVVKIYPDKPYLDLEYSVGPIPVEQDGIGKEIISRFCTNIDSNGTFFTDSNGREFIPRKRRWNEYENIASNYYPINTAIYMQDDKRSFAVLTDRSQGGGSLGDGCIEIMLHRRTLYDDARGVGEPINETDGGMSSYPPYGDAKRRGKGIEVDGKHRLVFTKAHSENHVARSFMDSMFATPIIFEAVQDASMSNSSFDLSVYMNDIPTNIQVVTLQRWDSDSVLLRLSHQFDVDEDSVLSRPARVDLSNLFVNHPIKNAVELTLSGNQLRSDWEQARKMKWVDKDMDKTSGRTSDEGYVVQLNPMEIRTFKVTF